VDFESPRLIELQTIGSSNLGYISIAENAKNVPFEIKRVYWTYYTPQNVHRGFHAHRNLQQVIFAVSGSIKFRTETKNSQKMEFVLDQPHIGIYLPPFIWRDIQFSHNAVLLCLASELFDESDYIREYEEFIK
jgi:hypothetical protein